jgi:phosphomannomutase/phosphoglucomutase
MQIASSIFREYDIRGIFQQELDERTVQAIGLTLGRHIGGNKIVTVGYDARTHSPLLSTWLSQGLEASGCNVLNMGMVATPVNYFTNYQKIETLQPAYPQAVALEPYFEATPDASIMITGSHNPPQYNGFKITVDHAPFFGEAIYALREEIQDLEELPSMPEPRSIPIDAISPYVDFMLEEFQALRSLRLPLLFDCGNGVAGTVLPQILDGLGLRYTALYCEPDGSFPNHHPDPSEEKNLADLKAALARGEAELGFAYDGDADRIAVLTRHHNIRGDQLALLYAMEMESPTVIGEVKCSQVMYDELQRRGCTPIMYKTGHSNLKVKMKETQADLACEVSGHIFFAHRYFGYDDAIYATLRLLELVANGVDLDAEIDALPSVYATEEIKVPTTEESKFSVIDAIKKRLLSPPEDLPPIREIIEIDGLRIHFEEGWALVRASNTTPILVTRYEATSEEKARLYEEKMRELIEAAKAEVED